MLTARVRRARPPVAWVIGLAVGALGTWLTLLLMPFGLLVYVLVAVALVLVGHRAALGGGMLLASGLWFVYLDRSMTATCEAMNSRGGFCEVIDPMPSQLMALGFAVAGGLLSIYALGKRSVRGGE
jgi:hypothetical protein